MTLLPSSLSARSKAALASAVTTPLAAATCASPKSASRLALLPLSLMVLRQARTASS
jgi:hypothetical protein